ncbi:hypothetical protein B0T18DRAFT_458471 [Schizothecium vesticola]|uniref:Uncharacterized protein n=1 Tax=Schizothecium vesticola TaxID=314040 RepID=A0AA40F6U4_9PEZI|nr:hypothetical protein B0T18DRAFT_458471 [Schizothecium vesticola]
MPRRPRKNRGKKPPGGNQGPRRAAAPLDEDHDMLTLAPPTPRYLPPQPPRPQAGGGGRQHPHPPAATTTPAPDTLANRSGRRTALTHLHPPTSATTTPYPRAAAPSPYPRPTTTNPNPYPPRCLTCRTTSCLHHHGAHAAVPCCGHCDFVLRCNYELRDTVAACLSTCGAALARWADDVGVGSGESVDMMEWQPEGTTLVVLGGREWGSDGGLGAMGRGGEEHMNRVGSASSGASVGVDHTAGGDKLAQGRDGQTGGGGGGGGMSPQGNGAPSPSPPPPPPAAVMSPGSAARIAMENKQHQQSQPYQVVNAPPTPPVYAAMVAALGDMGAGVLQVPPAPQQPQEVNPVVNGGGSGGPPPGLVAAPVHDGKCDVAGRSFWGYRDSLGSRGEVAIFVD